MKKASLILFVAIVVFACKKDDKHEGSYKVKYSVTGASVNQFDITSNTDVHSVYTPFTGTRDTTVYLSAGTVLKLDAKATSHNALIGSIYVDDTMVATLTDSDADGDSKTQVKIDYTIPVK
jgi:hypothetical protein